MNVRKTRLTGLSAAAEGIEKPLLKMRAVLIFLQTLHGSKRQMACRLVGELRAKGVRAAARTLYRWRRQYLVSGIGGLTPRFRSDRGKPRNFDQGVLIRISDAALRIRKPGDIRREYQGFSDIMSCGSFRRWVRWIQARVVEIPRREEI
jgi:hypothetical protein